MNGDDFCSMRELKLLIIAALLAIFGGLAKLFMSQKEFTFSRLLSCSIVSGFSGIMASYLMQCTDLSPAFQSFVIGMSGFAAPTALSAFTAIYERKLGIKLDNTGSKRKKREVR